MNIELDPKGFHVTGLDEHGRPDVDAYGIVEFADRGGGDMIRLCDSAAQAEAFANLYGAAAVRLAAMAA